MARITILLGLVLVLFGSGWAQQPAAGDLQKNLLRVTTREAVPERWQAGYDSITADSLTNYLKFLTDDTLNGRETASPDFVVAANYAASLFQLWGLQPAGDTPAPAPFAMMGGGRDATPPKPPVRGYLQRFPLKEITDATTLATLLRNDPERRQEFAESVDFTAMGLNPGSLTAPVVFAGYGIREPAARWDDYQKIDVKGKLVLVLAGAPGRDDINSPFWKDPELKKKYFPEGPMRRDTTSFAKLTLAQQLGAVGILVVRGGEAEGDIYAGVLERRKVRDDRPIIADHRRRFVLPGAAALMPYENAVMLSVSRDLATALLAGSGETVAGLVARLGKEGKPFSFAIPGTRLAIDTRAKETLTEGINVVAVVPGSDPVLKDEVVVVGAHLDHLGRQGDYIFNGANDNGSGSAAVLAIGRALMACPQKPKRTVVLALWSGEEQGLFGSRYYVSAPALPIRKTVAYLNLDMVAVPWDEASLRRMARMYGMDGTADLMKSVKADNFIPLSLTGETPVLDEALKKADAVVGFDLLLRPAAKKLDRNSGGSDHSSFAKAEVPWVFFIAGFGETYHQPGDQLETIDPAFYERMSRLVYLTLVNRADR